MTSGAGLAARHYVLQESIDKNDTPHGVDYEHGKGGMNKRKKAEREGVAARTPTQEEIAGRAYRLFMDRGGRHGHSLEDWLRAERELISAGVPQWRSATDLPLGLRLLAES
ncbi:MAG: DUF2934 domain-containing protein [bacterium]